MLSWNPEQWNQWPSGYANYAQNVREAGPQPDTWSVGGRRFGIDPGTEAWLFRQGGRDASSRGILGHATVTSSPWVDNDPKDATKRTTFVNLQFDWLLQESDVVGVQALEASAPNTKWRSIRRSGYTIPQSDVPAIRRLWSLASAGYVGPDDGEVPGTYEEGETSNVRVNRYERNRAARAACIAANGDVCLACGFDFRQVYGQMGDGYVQVHHVVPISQIGKRYTLDPVNDLVPLCANCHVMAHRQRPDPYTVKELKRQMRAARARSARSRAE